MARDEDIKINMLHFGETAPEGYHDPTRRWYDGPDGHLMLPEYPGYIKTARPLPAGEYRGYGMARPAEMVICNGYVDVQRNTREVTITVTAPEGTLAEAFFDPVVDGDAVGATTTVGTITYESDEVEADLTPSVTNQHILDFIALDGSVTLSLDVTDATTTDGVLTWTVTPAPWSAGDKLMLRIRSPRPSSP